MPIDGKKLLLWNISVLQGLEFHQAGVRAKNSLALVEDSQTFRPGITSKIPPPPEHHALWGGGVIWER